MIISREQTIRILRSERELQKRLLESCSGELARFKNGAKLIARNWLGANPVFKVVSNNPDRSDVVAIKEAIERGEYNLLCGKRYYC